MDGKQNPILSGESPQSVSSNAPNLDNIYPNPNEEKTVLNQGYQQPNIETNNQTQSGENKRPLIIVIASAVILTGVASIFFIPKLLGSNENEVKSTLDSINYILPSTISACKRVRDDAYSHNLSIDLYKTEVTSCKESATALFEIVYKLNPTGDAETQEAISTFKTSLDANMPNPNQLEKTLEIYTAMHNFNVALYDFRIDGQSLDYKAEKGEKLIEAANYFANFSDDELAQFGNAVEQLYSELHDTWQQFANEINEMGENSQANYEKYIDAEKNFNSYMDDNIPNISSSYPLANDENGEISNTLNNLMNKI